MHEIANKVTGDDRMVRSSYPGGGKFYGPIQIGPEAHPAFYRMGTLLESKVAGEWG